MNHKIIANVVGKIVLVEALLMALPALVSIFYGETDILWSFLVTITAALAIGSLLTWLPQPKDTLIYAKEGFVIVSLAWIGLSLIGALPFWLTGEIPSFVDAFFETVSGFTTTGASILTDVEGMSRGLLFWRSETHWVGGMGVLVFVMALIPNLSERSIHVLRAEVPGPTVGKLVPRIKDTAKILYSIYIVLTLVEIVFLLCGGMPLFDSVVHAFGTAGTGGFGIKADSIGGYSPYLQWVIAIFMLLFGVNFNLYYLLLIRRFRSALKSSELWTYLGIVAVAVLLIGGNIYPLYHNLGDTLRHATFQVSSLITTTGYSTVNFDLWPTFSKFLLVMLMLIGGCAGSTAGGLKVARVVLLFKQLKSEMQRLLHPRAVKTVNFEGKRVDAQTMTGVNVYLGVYLMVLVAVILLLSLEPLMNFESNVTAAVACFNNIGPGLSAVGPMNSYAGYSDFSTLVLSAAMLLGRLEIFPLLLFASPATWTKK
ncbi:MAG: TrkH family potassium uptake protein [Clostridia bacterium]|nr:TrkH family potassium uptake protein [Clostridia bacterium]